MSRQISRSELFARLSGSKDPVRPPWALTEAEFERVCSPCTDCIDACPEQVIVRGRAGYPVVDFSRRSCTFCGDCARACTKGAFVEPVQDTTPWSVRATISNTCIEFKGTACRLCEPWCEPEAIRFRPVLNGKYDVQVIEEKCTGCGACIAPCPVNAIDIGAITREEVYA